MTSKTLTLSNLSTYTTNGSTVVCASVLEEDPKEEKASVHNPFSLNGVISFSLWNYQGGIYQVDPRALAKLVVLVDVYKKDPSRPLKFTIHFRGEYRRVFDVTNVFVEKFSIDEEHITGKSRWVPILKHFNTKEVD